MKGMHKERSTHSVVKIYRNLHMLNKLGTFRDDPTFEQRSLAWVNTLRSTAIEMMQDGLGEDKYQSSTASAIKTELEVILNSEADKPVEI
jgi:hypothetical protein